MTKLKAWMGNLLLIVGGIILGLLIVETFVISTDIALPPFERWVKVLSEAYQSDTQLGFKPKPNLKDSEFAWERAGLSEIINTDSYGFRNLSRDYTKSNLYFVGDSFTWGIWVSREETFYGLIESQLNQPVITLGVPAYGFEQYEVLFRDWVTKYQPRTTVLCIFANDLHKINSLKDFLDRNTRPMSWYKKTLSYQLIFNNYYSPILTRKTKNGMRLASIRSFDRKPFDRTGGIGPDIDYLTSNTHFKVEEALSRIIDLTQENKTKLFIFLIPSKESTYIQEYTQLFNDKIKYIETEEIGYKRLCDLAETKGTTCVDLTEEFRQNSGGEKLYFDLDNHWNMAGHKLASRLVLDVLRQEKGVDSKTDIKAVEMSQIRSVSSNKLP